MQIPPRRFLILAAAFALLASALFLPGLGGGFILDDGPTITNNPVVQVNSLDPQRLLGAAYGFAAGGGSRALPMLSFALDHWRAGMDAAAFKTTNIAIHCLTAFALAYFFRLLLAIASVPPARATLAALGLAAAWAAHPLQVSSVLYIVQRMQTMGTLFLVLALLAYLKMRQAQMAGQRSRQFAFLAGLCWVLALACKEDSVLLPAYTLALELTVLRFRADNENGSRALRTLYWILGSVAVAGFFLYVLPRHWSWEAYHNRDFSTFQRLLTQARVLVMYLGQVLWPMPGNLPFYYDDLQPSRGLLTPWTTLPAILLIFGLLAAAWRLRHRRPLLALGILLFFAGHAITSNVVGLELAFEHRNHFPLIGAVLAIGDLSAVLAARLKVDGRKAAVAACAALFALGGITLIRAQAWGSPLGFARYETRIAPTSIRAWNGLCLELYRLGGGPVSGNPNLDEAIGACSHAATLNTGNVSSLTYLLSLKTLRGTIQERDWQTFLQRLDTDPLSGANSISMWILIRNAREGVPLERMQLRRVIAAANRHYAYSAVEYASIGYFLLGFLQQPDDAYAYFARAARMTGDPMVTASFASDLEKNGRSDLAARLLQTPLAGR